MKRLLRAGVALLAISSAKAEIGVNLDFMTDWSPAWSYVDGFKHARTWLPQRISGTHPWDTGEQLDLTPEGWVRSLGDDQAAAALMFWDLQGHYPGGIYTCLYDGVGELDFRGSAQATETSPGKVRVAVEPTEGGVILRVVKTDRGNPVRNIRFLMPGYEDGRDIFHPLFLETLKPFRVIRFMNWQRMNTNPSGKWADRSTPDSITQRGAQGVCIEHMVELANQTGADPWFCMPHLADDDYVRNFAQMVKARLDSRRKIYVEYSNEVWNGIFPQARHAREMGLSLGLSNNEYESQLRFYSQRSVEIFKIWEEVFGGTNRLVRALAAHSANPNVGRMIVQWRDAGRNADALAIAPYFGSNLGGNANVTSLGVDEVLALCREDILNQESFRKENAATAKLFGLTLIAYEGGQHLVGTRGMENNSALNTLFASANDHPAMEELYALDQEQWRQAGGELFVAYKLTGTHSKSGFWGLLRWQDQPPGTAPKYQGLLQAKPAR